MKLNGKKALVTESSQGIGQAIALRLAEEGADAVINYHSHPETAEETATAIQQRGRRSLAIQAKIGNAAGVQDLIQQSVEALGGPDILVNNAGVEKHASSWEVTEADYDLVLNTNLKGAFFATQAFVKHRIQVKQPGKVINISSVHEELPFPHFTSYCASKGAVKMMMRNLSIELAPYGITINNIAPRGDRDADQYEVVARSGETQCPSAKHPLGAAREDRRRRWSRDIMAPERVLTRRCRSGAAACEGTGPVGPPDKDAPRLAFW
jgi:glucose 1-dehydrogenase